MPLSSSLHEVSRFGPYVGSEEWPSANGFTHATAYATPSRHDASPDLTEAEKAALSEAAAGIAASFNNC